jgi:hypothetical protein
LGARLPITFPGDQARKRRGCEGDRLSRHQIGKFRMILQIVHHEATTGDHLEAVGADQFERALYQFRCDAAAAQRAWRLGVGDDDRRRPEAVICKSDGAFDIEFEAAERLVVANGCCSNVGSSPKQFSSGHVPS